MYVKGSTRSRDTLEGELVIIYMASGFLRASLCFVIDDSTFTGISERSKLALEQTKEVIRKTSEEAYNDRFDQFAVELLATLESCLDIGPMMSTPKGVTHQREKLWKAFHRESIMKLPEMWKKFLQTVDLILDPLVYQTVNQKMFEEILKSRFGVQPRKSPQCQASLSQDEECIVRYAAGYIPLVLLKKHEKSQSLASVSFVECLSSMAVNGEESSFLEYTRDWLVKINRGGLFEVNDLAYQLFKEIEINLQTKLKDHLVQPIPDKTKEDLLSTAISNENVQFYWSMISTDIQDEAAARDLLHEIAELWLTIRGFSVAREWMEMYKACTVKATKKSKPLRKSLKKK